MVFQKKETGTQVALMMGIKFETLQVYTYKGDVIGLLGNQRVAGVIDTATRDALLNGNTADIVTQATGQGMAGNYVLVTWNETAQSNGYYITDLQIGVVVTITRDFNTGPAYLLEALKAVPWLSAVISKLNIGNYSFWQSWKLLNQKRPEPYNQWVHESRSQPIRVSTLYGEANLPALPDVATVKATVKAEGQFQQALGEFTTQMLDKGYAVTFPVDSYDIDICYEKGNVFVIHSGADVGGTDTWYYDYYVHVRFWWEFTTDPEITNLAGARTLIAPAVIYAIIAIIGAIVVTSIATYNLTHTRSEYQRWGWRLNPNTGQWEWVITESGSTEGPPDWWSWVVPIIALIGAGAVVYFMLPLRPKEGRKK